MPLWEMCGAAARATWMHAIGAKRRRDYVCIDQCWADAILTSYVDADFIIDIPQQLKKRKTKTVNANHEKEDHRVAALQLASFAKDHTQMKSKKRVAYCRMSLKDQNVLEVIKTQLSQLELPPWQSPALRARNAQQLASPARKWPGRARTRFPRGYRSKSPRLPGACF